MAKILKERMAQEFSGEFEKIDSFIAFTFQKMTARQAYQLRKHLNEQDIKMKVVKNTIVGVAFSQLYNTKMESLLKGPTAIAYGCHAPTDIVKILLDWTKKEPGIHIKGAYIPKQVLTRKQTEDLAKIPPRPILLAMLAGLFESSLQQMANIFTAPLQDISYAIDSLIEKKEKESASASV